MIEIKQVDYSNIDESDALVMLLSAYAVDPMGGGEDLSAHTKQRLIEEMSKRPHIMSFIIYVDKQPAGFANCIESFSTFNAASILNIHDFAVLPDFRGLNLSQHLLSAIFEQAKKLSCCKVTLEVLEGNTAAIAAYKKAGFNGYELDAALGKAMFWEKKL